ARMREQSHDESGDTIALRTEPVAVNTVDERRALFGRERTTKYLGAVRIDEGREARVIGEKSIRIGAAGHSSKRLQRIGVTRERGADFERDLEHRVDVLLRRSIVGSRIGAADVVGKKIERA